jgi:hypothetical protein
MSDYRGKKEEASNYSDGHPHPNRIFLTEAKGKLESNQGKDDEPGPM